MTPADLAVFIAQVRAIATECLARLDTIDPAGLSRELRVAFERVRADWLALLTMSEEEAVALHLAACEHAERELTAAELRGLLGRQ